MAWIGSGSYKSGCGSNVSPVLVFGPWLLVFGGEGGLQ